MAEEKWEVVIRDRIVPEFERLAVLGGWIYRVLYENSDGCLMSTTYVPNPKELE
ncbi:MAG: hypothetical protein O7B79_09265 [SAR324 cluster bacterium]|nr:hypothetical protein [SAR324 cluster bacterium]